MSVKKRYVFENKLLRLTTGEYIGVVGRHVNHPHKGGYYQLEITRDVSRAFICSYDGNFIITQESNCTKADCSLRMPPYYGEGKPVNLVFGGRCGKRGEKDFYIDQRTGMITCEPLVLGKPIGEKSSSWSGGVELTMKDDKSALRIKNYLGKDLAGKFYKPHYFQFSDGSFIGRRGDRQGSNSSCGEWRYMALSLTNNINEALACTYDGHFISTHVDIPFPFPCCCLSQDEDKTECVFDIWNAIGPLNSGAYGTYSEGSHLILTNSVKPGRTRMKGMSREFIFYPDGQIGPKIYALGKKDIDGEERLVLVDQNSPNAVKLDMDYLLKVDEPEKPEINIRIENNNLNRNYRKKNHLNY